MLFKFFFTSFLKTFSYARRLWSLGIAVLCFLSMQAQMEVPVRYKNGILQYEQDQKGNRIIDFSYCGYHASEKNILWVEPKVFVPYADGDATDVIQEAIDRVASMPIQANGFRGAVQLAAGVFELAGRLQIKESGIVLRGSGFGEGGTTLVATGTNRQTLIRIFGQDDRIFEDAGPIKQPFVPVNSFYTIVENASLFKVGQSIEIKRPSTIKWIEALGMKTFGGEETGYLGWKPGQRVVRWERKITKISRDTIFWDVPLTMALDTVYGQSVINLQKWPGRISEIGIENLNLESSYNTLNSKDESHCFDAISIENAENVWVRQIQFKHFAGSAVAVFETGRKVTVQDCVSLQPVSEEANWRRYTFFTMGQQTLFQRLYAQNGYHDFAVGFCAAGPNAFVECESSQPLNFSGTIDSWATGVLFDVVKVDGHELSFCNRMGSNQGAGWTAANSVFWNCSAARIKNYAPPGAMNYAFGVWAAFEGNGAWYSQNNHISPRSLYYAQLEQRMDKKGGYYSDCYMPSPASATSSPTIGQAADYTEQAFVPTASLKDFIYTASQRDHIKVLSTGLPVIKKRNRTQDHTIMNNFTVQNGWLSFNDKLLSGMRITVPWWRGVPRPYEALKASPAITRFVPGRNGNGYTDNIEDVVAYMTKNNIVGIEHNYGLWYDRRRDDHERVRRMDGEVWAPFYEQPFARSGKETAWDGLSKYDLTQYNPFYWDRLAEYATQGALQGKILVQHHYFQHNVLEAGAHWADSPWRPVNNINDTGFPEPAPYAGDKRIFLAEQFYDVTHPVRRELHKAYIRQCLDNFSDDMPVLHLISAEYTGPLSFVEFWLDVIIEWQEENKRDVMVGLSATKDVQDAILQNPKYRDVVDVIDIRYWAYKEDQSLYAPQGGVNLAPRQHARLEKPGKRSFQSVYRSVREYKESYPKKAVIYSEGQYDQFGWAVLMAGGSLPVLPALLPAGFVNSVITMQPVVNADSKTFLLRNAKGESVIYMPKETSCKINFSGKSHHFYATKIEAKTGLVISRESLQRGKPVVFHNNDNKDVVVYISIK
ncbi:DUF6298 domain-containing protein [Geofilum sp. OHC36d9]|uniref:DUF6298 domain-containing protein n=1 Tax=Geofilum sp. OHC36d9 TaxID=3458413 RepID=UPI0040341B88